MAQRTIEPRLTIVDLVASDAAGGVLNWRPAQIGAFIVMRLGIDVVTASTGASTVDYGIAATGVLNDTLIDGLSHGTAGQFCNIKNAGTNGLASRKLTSSQYVTGSVASGASAGLVGTASIYWQPVGV